MLSDFWPHGEVAVKYNIFREVEGFSERANVLIDENGNMLFFKIYNLPEMPDIDKVISLL